ncbi:MAG TPA: pyruvate, water dikinase regulatory protein [Usitatibacteraceae bacterium]|nr:pyruvate, water dikinase regulatory protein [Usitatibacteraceae bacterium]
MPHRRTVFFVSDRTGITVEMLGSSLLTQFDTVEFRKQTLPFVDTLEKARSVVAQIEAARRESNKRPLVFTSLMKDELRNEIATANAMVLDLFDSFIVPIEAELGVKSAHAVGRSHSAGNVRDYNKRIEAVNYTMAHDDGVTNRNLDEADIILVGVSRSGKTPTCLYLALQFGVKAANYPLIPEDLEKMRLPGVLLPLKHKVWGLTIVPERLQTIRQERKPDSKYASLANCQWEVKAAEQLMTSSGILFLNSTTKSIEELATFLLHEAQLDRRVY